MAAKSVRFSQTVQVHAHAVTLGCYSGGSGNGPPVQLDWTCLYQMECPLASPRSGSPRLTPQSPRQRTERLLDAGIDVNEMWDAEAIANVVRMQRRESSMDHLKEPSSATTNTDHVRNMSPQGKRALQGFMARRR